MKHDDSGSVIKKARQGHREAQRELYESTIGYAWFVARRYLKNDEDIADVLQESYISVFRNLHTFDGERPFNPWLHAIVSRKCLNLIKKNKMVFVPYKETEDRLADTDGIVPDRWLEQEDKRKEILQIIDGLPEKQRMAVTLFYFEQFEISKIAQEMGVKDGTVKAHLFHGRQSMKNEIIARETRAGMEYLHPAGAVSRLAKLYELEAASAVAPAKLAAVVWSVVIAAGKADIRKWFLIGVEQGHTSMLIVYDRMDYPENSDKPYYCDDAEKVYRLLRDFNHDPMCKVMEIYDLTVGMETQLAEDRAWHLPDLPESDDEAREPLPDKYPASGLLTTGETRLRFMEHKNAEFINGKYAGDFGELGAVANPLHVFTDGSHEFVYPMCVYILEQAEATKATVAAVYDFKPDGTVISHSSLLMMTDDEVPPLVPLPQHHAVAFDLPYITFDLCYAHRKETYGYAYQHCHRTSTESISDGFDGLLSDSGSISFYPDTESHELYEQALWILRNLSGWLPDAMRLLHTAAEEGHAGAMNELGNYYSAKKPDAEKAAYWYNRAKLVGYGPDAKGDGDNGQETVHFADRASFPLKTQTDREALMKYAASQIREKLFSKLDGTLLYNTSGKQGDKAAYLFLRPEETNGLYAAAVIDFTQEPPLAVVSRFRGPCGRAAAKIVSIVPDASDSALWQAVVEYRIDTEDAGTEPETATAAWNFRYDEANRVISVTRPELSGGFLLPLDACGGIKVSEQIIDSMSKNSGKGADSL